jgi:hypothetical protein
VSDLRTRIAAAIWDELDRQREPGFGPFVDRNNAAIDTTGSDGIDMSAVADAVIRELGLHRHDQDFSTTASQQVHMYRYFTDWIMQAKGQEIAVRNSTPPKC